MNEIENLLASKPVLNDSVFLSINDVEYIKMGLFKRQLQIEMQIFFLKIELNTIRRVNRKIKWALSKKHFI